MWYQNIRSASFSFVTIHASVRRTDGWTNGRTDGQNCDNNTVRCITCRTVKSAKTSEWRKSHMYNYGYITIHFRHRFRPSQSAKLILCFILRCRWPVCRPICLFVLGLVILCFVYLLFVIGWLPVPVQLIAWKTCLRNNPSSGTLTPSTPAVPNRRCSKGPAPYWSNPPFLIFDIRALWRSWLSARAPECQKLMMAG